MKTVVIKCPMLGLSLSSDLLKHVSESILNLDAAWNKITQDQSKGFL